MGVVALLECCLLGARWEVGMGSDFEGGWVMDFCGWGLRLRSGGKVVQYMRLGWENRISDTRVHVILDGFSRLRFCEILICQKRGSWRRAYISFVT
jgi:hypothetical protein